MKPICPIVIEERYLWGPATLMKIEVGRQHDPLLQPLGLVKQDPSLVNPRSGEAAKRDVEKSDWQGDGREDTMSYVR